MSLPLGVEGSDSGVPVVVVRPSKSWQLPSPRELWAYRELLYFLVWRDVKVRYKQTALGASWALLQPLLMTVVFAIFLGALAGVRSDGVPYPLFAYTGLVPWTLFSQSLGASAQSLVVSSHLVSKVYFPRVILPIAAAGSYCVDFAIALLLLVPMALYYDVGVSLSVLWIPLLFISVIAAALAFAIWLAAVNVRYRDVRYAVPFALQLWLFLSPVAYSRSLVPDDWRALYDLNPMVGVIEGFRAAVVGSPVVFGPSVVASAVLTLLLLVTGLAYFQRVERSFADVI